MNYLRSLFRNNVDLLLLLISYRRPSAFSSRVVIVVWPFFITAEGNKEVCMTHSGVTNIKSGDL